ncbi:MAG: LysR substrate-binding domain-containing protein, partial [Halioglobus sp.]
IVGSPGPVPLQKGYRAIPLSQVELVPVIASSHEVLANKAIKPEAFRALIPTIRKVITHDTSISDITRSEGLSSDGKTFYVQNIDQKVEAILAGVGIGHLPRHRIHAQLGNGELVELELSEDSRLETFLAWKISNKGRGLQVLTQRLSA